MEMGLPRATLVQMKKKEDKNSNHISEKAPRATTSQETLWTTTSQAIPRPLLNSGNITSKLQTPPQLQSLTEHKALRNMEN